MAPPDTPIRELRLKDAKQALEEDKYDCTACRLTGSAAFVGLGVYSYYTGMRNLRKQEQVIMNSTTKYKMGSRKLGIATISASLVGVGVYRLFN
ncbi:hypothetical protein N7468_010156 [Penicillium chermesinum]|uniref:Distal membrane-arm assembly complex protein 1-like domain-containing protein n=1 Tax=Penicillium chermesinum TaxID=63820 RepID=A0A9W9NE44_9EURO|nr:uncharacterized protein N7468_010156 [Penicillium chermesinum]KAJ5217148.1 hypothetical protein N7468_010156 [Penicillium chermesinum]KAJ6171232.1 hypothetical protein N7470_000299 [Penicillium chermesinum]